MGWPTAIILGSPAVPPLVVRFVSVEAHSGQHERFNHVSGGRRSRDHFASLAGELPAEHPSLFTLGWVFVNLEQRSGGETSAMVRWLVGIGMFGGGALFLLSFYVAGAAGVPRRYALEPAPGPFFANFATVGALVLLLGFILAVSEALRLARHKPSQVRQ